MKAKAISPILNVSDMEATFTWFDKLGWKRLWDWGQKPGEITFGAVGSGECEIFLCLNAQGGRGKGENTTTFGPGGSESQDKGAWMSIWVDNVDEIHERAVREGLEVVHEPENMPWQVRELHLRHPDGHVFRVSQSIEHG